MHYIHKVGCTSVRQVPVTGTCFFRLTTQIWRDLCLSETQIHRSSDLWVSHGYTCVDPQVTQTRAQPYCDAPIKFVKSFSSVLRSNSWTEGHYDMPVNISRWSSAGKLFQFLSLLMEFLKPWLCLSLTDEWKVILTCLSILWCDLVLGILSVSWTSWLSA